MAKYTKRAALAHIRAQALACLDANRERMELNAQEISCHLHGFADINHKYVRDHGANSLGTIIAEIQVSAETRLLRILMRVESLETALSYLD